jgi:hypothetical protein
MQGAGGKGTLTVLVGWGVGASHMGQFNADMGLDWMGFVSVQATIAQVSRLLLMNILN